MAVRNSPIVALSLMVSAGITLCASRMMPIKKPGIYGYRYYSSEHDTHEFMTAAKLAGWVKKLLTPRHLQKPAELMHDLTACLNPTQAVPPAYSIEPRITWIGHASFLIQINGFNIITDPIFGDINALNDPLFWIGNHPVRLPAIALTKRAVAPGIKLEDMPPLDAIIISHNHSDHMDADALMVFAKNKQTTIFVPEGEKSRMLNFGFDNHQVIEKTWWESAQCTKGNKQLTITCLPALHCSIRFSPLSYRESLWASWMLSSNDTNIFFAGDTAHGPHFAQIAQEFSSIDAALMPIGPTYEGENKARNCHTDTMQALDAFAQLQAQRCIPMHYGTFAWGNDHLCYPIRELPKVWDAHGDTLQDKELVWLGHGQSVTLL